MAVAPNGRRVVRLNTQIAVVLSVLIACTIASWTFLVSIGKIPPTIPQWAAPAAGVTGLVAGALVRAVHYLKTHGIDFEIENGGPPSGPKVSRPSVPVPGLPDHRNLPEKKRDPRRETS